MSDFTTNDGGPAFPVVAEQYDYGFERTMPKSVAPGMTLRDYFAAKAMQAAWVCVTDNGRFPKLSKEVAALAYDMADAMLKARSA